MNEEYDAVVQEMYIPAGGELSWRLTMLMARLTFLIQQPENLSDHYRQMYMRGMYEAVGMLTCPMEDIPDFDAAFPPTEITKRSVNGMAVPMPLDIMGRAASESILHHLEQVSGKDLAQILEQEIVDNHCENDLQQFLGNIIDSTVDTATQDIDAKLAALLDTKE